MLIPLIGLPFDLSSSQTRSSLFGKQNYVKKQEIEEDIFVNFQWPGKPGFPQKIQVYIVPVNWFSQLNFLFSYFYIYFYIYFSFFDFCFLFLFLFYLLAVLDQLRSR